MENKLGCGRFIFPSKKKHTHGIERNVGKKRLYLNGVRWQKSQIASGDLVCHSKGEKVTYFKRKIFSERLNDL